jgi:hypothetical protein
MRDRSTLFWLISGLFLVYFFTSSGGLETSDAVLRYQTAVSWIEGKGGVLPRELGWRGGAFLPDGRVYSFYGPLQPVFMTPFLLAVRAFPSAGVDRSVVDTFGIALGLFPLLSALVIGLLWVALRLLGFRAREALLACLAIGLASLFWHYARTGQEESLVALGYAVWLLGTARLAAGRPWPVTLLCSGAAIALATRWASLPMLAVLFAVSLVLLARHRQRLKLADLALGAGIFTACIALLLLYNQVRFGTPFETGYGLLYAHEGWTMFQLDGYLSHLAALLASPYRGLLLYSPIVLAGLVGLFFLHPRDQRLLGIGGIAVLATALLFFASFRFWNGGSSWGPRFLASPHVLLAPALAALFAWRPRLALLLPVLAALQITSTMLPASTEDYVWYNADRQQPGFCYPWRFECTAIPQRLPRALQAVANTVANRPGTVLSGRPIVAPELVLSTSDYRTLYWWPFRIAFRMRRIPLSVALLLCALGLSAATFALFHAWRSTAGETDEAARSSA